MTDQFADLAPLHIDNEEQFNLTQSFSILLLYDSLQRRWRGWLMILMCAISLPLNVLLFRHTRRRGFSAASGNNQILQHLSVANCVTAVFCLLTKGIWEIVVEWHLGDTMCKVMHGVEKFALYANTYLVVVLSLQRVINFKCSNQNRARSKKRARYLIVAAWSLSSLCAIPQVFGHAAQTDPMSNLTLCQHDYYYYEEHSEWANYLEGYMHIVLLYFVPVFMIITSSTILSCAILKRMKRFGLASDDLHVETMAIFEMQGSHSRSTSADSGAALGGSGGLPPITPLVTNAGGSVGSSSIGNGATNNTGHSNSNNNSKQRQSRQRLTEIVMITRYCCHERCARLHGNAPHYVTQSSIAQFGQNHRFMHRLSYSSGNASENETRCDRHVSHLSHVSHVSPRLHSHGDEATRATLLFQKARLRSVQVAATTVGSYVLCWSPYYVFQLVLFAAPNASNVDTNLWDMAAWLNVIGQVYIIVHPLLYGAINVRNIRRRFRKLCIRRRRKHITLAL